MYLLTWINLLRININIVVSQSKHDINHIIIPSTRPLGALITLLNVAVETNERAVVTLLSSAVETNKLAVVKVN